jgi:hypothetical protein
LDDLKFENVAKNKLESMKTTLVSLCLSGKMFRKTSVLILLLSACYLTSKAQVSFGVKGGINFNNTVIKDVPPLFSLPSQSEVAVGFHIGLFSQIKLTNRLNLIPEFQYSQRGAKYNSGSMNININYLELPIMASYSIKSFALDFGPQLAYRLSSTVDAYKDFEFGLVGGVRFNFAKDFFVTGRYYYGITAISEIAFSGSNGQSFSNGLEYSRSIQVGVGYKIK